MTIAEPAPQTFEVAVPIEFHDQAQALLLDHFLDHLHLLTHLASDDPIAREVAVVCLLPHRCYRPLPDGEPETLDRLIRLIQADAALLFAAYLRVLRLPPDERPAFYRAILDAIPFTGHAAYQRGDDGHLRAQFDPPLACI